MDSKLVSSLEDLAFEASFKDIVASLILCYEHRPEANRLSCLANPSTVSKCFLTSEKLRILVRSQLAHFLEGTMSQKVRKVRVNRFYDFLSNGEEAIDVWVFFDAVLDGSFKELQTFIAFPDSEEPDDKLIPTILKWSPLVEKLTINCDPIIPIDLAYHATDGTLAKLTSTIRKLNSLKQLTHLCLHSICGVQRFTILSLIGTACPNLSLLGVYAVDMNKNDILALIVGESIKNLLDFDNYYGVRRQQPWSENGSLEHLELPSKYVTPICSTLLELQLYYTRSYDDGGNYNHIGSSVAALALRHLPLLQIVEKRFPASLAVLKLHNSNVAEEEKSRDKFLRAIQEVSERSGNTSPAQNLKFSTTFSDFVNVKYEAMLRAIGQTCPMLKEVTFCDSSFAFDYLSFDDGDSDMAIQLEIVLDPLNLQAVFNGWPKLTKIRFHRISLRYMTVILEVFGAGLQHLEFKHCDEIELADLALCQQLKRLFILSSTTLLPEKFESRFDSATFLPQLKIFESVDCLGRTSRLFEEKPNLVSLVLNCFHGEIESERRHEPFQKRFKHSAQASSRRFGLGKIRELWSQLEVLNIKQFTGLSMSLVSDVIPYLRKLKLMILPQQISSYHPTTFLSMRDQLLERNPPGQIDFEEFDKYASCKIFRPDGLGHRWGIYF